MKPPNLSASPVRILLVFGTRPEAVKLAPVARELRNRAGCEVRICVTAQHRQMLDQVLQAFALTPDFDLDIMRESQDLTSLTSRCLTAVSELLRELDKLWRPDWIVVQGDTTTTLAAALAAFYADIPVAHVEAGLRTGDLARPFPEEMNRQLVTRIARLHFAPTLRARQSLLAENVPAEAIHVTGNTVVDALQAALLLVRAGQSGTPALDVAGAAPRWPVADGRRLVLVTGHRRESFGDGFQRICKALHRIARRRDVEIVYPVHLNPHVREPVHAILGGQKNIRLLEPLAYLPFVSLMDAASIILTDSGGIQEEAPALGKPVLVMRDVTERPEAVEAGSARLVGTDVNQIVAGVSRLLDDPAEYARMSQVRNPFGDGQAARRIADVLVGREG